MNGRRCSPRGLAWSPLVAGEKGERMWAQTHRGRCSEKAVYCLLTLYRGTERSYKYSIGCCWQCYFWSQLLFCFSSEGDRTVKVHFRLQSTAASPASLVQSKHDSLPGGPRPPPPPQPQNGYIYRDVTHHEWAAKAEHSNQQPTFTEKLQQTQHFLEPLCDGIKSGAWEEEWMFQDSTKERTLSNYQSGMSQNWSWSCT